MLRTLNIDGQQTNIRKTLFKASFKEVLVHLGVNLIKIEHNIV